MPEREFDLYLDILSRLLRLRAEQRAEIADELRDHLESRLDELTALGLSREAAIRRALEEFGDAAGLAQHFTHIARIKRRRLIMRCTLGTVAVTAVVLLALSAFWPQNAAVDLPTRAVGQEAANDRQEQGAPSLRGKDDSIARVESKLDQRVKVEFDEVPLCDVLKFLGDTIEVDILTHGPSLADAGVETDEPVTMRVSHTTVPARTVLETILEPLGLDYVIREGFLYIVSVDLASEYAHVDVYNVRDLLEAVGGEPGARHTGAQAPRVPVRTVQFADVMPDDDSDDTPGERLIGVVVATVGVPWETVDGMGGTIEEFNGLLVVRTTQKGHREIRELLKMMRSAHEERPLQRSRRSGGTFPPVEPQPPADPAGPFPGADAT